jgi:hypothetical protein
VGGPERSQEGISVAAAPMRATTPARTSNMPTTRPVLRRLRAYMWRPDRVIAPLTVPVTGGSPLEEARLRCEHTFASGLWVNAERAMTP